MGFEFFCLGLKSLYFLRKCVRCFREVVGYLGIYFCWRFMLEVINWVVFWGWRIEVRIGGVWVFMVGVFLGCIYFGVYLIWFCCVGGLKYLVGWKRRLFFDLVSFFLFLNKKVGVWFWKECLVGVDMGVFFRFFLKLVF